MIAVEIRINDSMFIRTLRLQFHLLNSLNRNPKEDEMARCSYIMAHILIQSHCAPYGVAPHCLKKMIYKNLVKNLAGWN